MRFNFGLYGGKNFRVSLFLLVSKKSRRSLAWWILELSKIIIIFPFGYLSSNLSRNPKKTTASYFSCSSPYIEPVLESSIPKNLFKIFVVVGRRRLRLPFEGSCSTYVHNFSKVYGIFQAN